MLTSPSTVVVMAFAFALAVSSEARGQHEGHGTGARDSADAAGARESARWHVMAQGIPVVTRAANTAGGVTLTEAYLSQAMIMTQGAWWGGHVQLDATLNAEGLTMKRGELSTGAFGEGYVDRRHPHTYMHELMLTGAGGGGPLSYSVSAGLGFVPFGTDDPMMRPFEKYPINHHLAQILERALVSGAVRIGPALVEGATFGGDEPSSSSSRPQLRRFGDSWSVRATALPAKGIELQASYARVASPEQVAGFGLGQHKRSVSGRLISADGSRYLLAEWARTIDRDPTRSLDLFRFESALAEGAMMAGPVGLALRLEQTDRPEEDRQADLFRNPRPAPDLAISGITRWRVATLAVTLPSVIDGPVQGYPFVEIARLGASTRDERSVFSARRFYGERAPWMASAGIRVRYGSPHARMGRYGVAEPDDAIIRTLGASRDGSIGSHH